VISPLAVLLGVCDIGLQPKENITNHDFVAQGESQFTLNPNPIDEHSVCTSEVANNKSVIDLSHATVFPGHFSAMT